MKASKYNIFVPYKDDMTLIFNGITKHFFILPKHQTNIINEIFENPDGSFNGVIKEQLISSGFIVEADKKEQEQIIKARKQELKLSHYTLMLLPTYDCNFSCWYCIQKHAKVHFDEGIIERIKTHISSYLQKNKIKVFEIAWFGGEPLLSKGSIIEISEFSKKLCDLYNIHFFNSMTTNASLFSGDFINTIKDLNFRSFQITIDGNKHDHNKVKFDNSICSAYDKTLSNIKNILKFIPDSRILLRLNYSDKNLKIDSIIQDLDRFISISEKQRIEIVLQKIWQVNEMKINNEILIQLKKKFSERGFIISNEEWKNNYGCYVERKHFNSILPNGNIVKCNNCDLSTKLGTINEFGEIKREIKLDYKLFNKCYKCKFLPICFGKCPEHRFDSLVFKKKICNNPQHHFNAIIDYCQNSILNNRK